jgi:hypothetical protein
LGAGAGEIAEAVGFGCGAGDVSQCTSSKTALSETIKTVR